MNSIESNERKHEPNPILKANIFSKIFYIWLRPVFKKGLQDRLDPTELYDNHPCLESQKLTTYFQEHWNTELRRKKPSLLRAITTTFVRRILWICVLFSIFEISMHALQPLLLGGLLSYFSPGQTHLTKTVACLYAAGIVVSSFVLAVCFNLFSFHVFFIGLSARYACGGLIYRQCLKFSVSASHNNNSNSSANAISILCNYFNNVELAFFHAYNLWKAPLEVFVFGYVMWYQIGWQSTIGIGVMLTFIPLQIWAGKGLAHYRRESGKWGEARVQLMNEIIAAIQVIKMYAWEECFAKLIATLRQREVKSIRGTMQINAGVQSSVMISRLALFVSMMAYIYTDEALTPSRIFIATSYYAALNEAVLRNWSQAVTFWAELVACLKRANAFLLAPTQAKHRGFDNLAMESDEPLKHPMKIQRKGVYLQHVSSTWDRISREQKPTLHIKDVTCNIYDGQFLGVIGNVGAGKTTLLNAILGEVELATGTVEVNGSMSYAAQDAWIFRGTVRENIVFVEKYDEERYKQVLHACELERDVEQLPHGDATIIGERGLNLSGGQKARLNLARAVYRQADIYLFDDPLAAVDSAVGKRLMEKCFLEFLKGKIRILVTHHVQYMQHVDHVLFMESGELKQQGNYAQLNGLMKTGLQSEQERELIDGNDSEASEYCKSETKAVSTDDFNYKEHQIKGSVKFETYLNYFKALRQPFVVFAVLSLFVVVQICQSSIDVFTAKWATLEDTLPQLNKTNIEDRRYYNAAVYAALICSIMVFFLLRTLGFFLMCLKISLRIHDLLVRSVTRASMLFFNINPAGRIINRFSNDLWKVDVAVPQAMLDAILFFVDLAATLLIVGMTNYWLLLPAAVILALLYFSQKLYMKSSRSLKRIESITCSPVYSHIIQTVQGLSTIRALKATKQLELEFHKHHNAHISSVFLTLAVNRAFGCWVDIICSLYIFLVTFSFLILGDKFNSGDVGLAITQSLMLLAKCQYGIRRTANMENYMTSAERVMEYINEPEEHVKETINIAPKIKGNLKFDAKWPDAGQICFEDVRMRYRKHDSPTLKGLSFTVQPKEKIGIVGRTGAGKSSIIQAIFRLARNEGSITIDGRNINFIDLHELRSRISIIPQDPVLFTGTLRFNLDPFELKSDEEMWHVLNDVELKSHVLSLEGGLDYRVSDGGANFSTGQRQLVCLARAILRQNKILIMDEATANVDPHTDELIQTKIRTNFNESTVLTIAHRLHTVMESDRVLVMDAGQIVEMDHPKSLLQNKHSHFYKLVNKTTNSNAQ